MVAPALPIGIAQGAVDEFTSCRRGTSGPGRTVESVLVQMRLAEASVEVEAARELHCHSACEILEGGPGAMAERIGNAHALFWAA